MLGSLGRAATSRLSALQKSKKAFLGSVLGRRGGHRAVRAVCRKSEGTSQCLRNIFDKYVLYSYAKRCRRVRRACRPARKAQQPRGFPRSILFIPLGGRGGAAAPVFPPGPTLCPRCLSERRVTDPCSADATRMAAPEQSSHQNPLCHAGRLHPGVVV